MYMMSPNGHPIHGFRMKRLDRLPLTE